MIYTVTLNPSIDHIVSVDNMKLGTINRTSQDTIFPGGKGINVSLVLKNLGIKSVALGFIAGLTGDLIKTLLNEEGVCSDFVRAINGLSRINTKVRSSEETEINGKGPDISKKEINDLLEKISVLNDGDYLVLSGSVPSSLSPDIYKRIMDHVADKHIKTIVDTSGDPLRLSLGNKPYLIKPNIYELEEIFGTRINDIHELIDCSRKLQEMGARNICVSMGGDGAVLICEDGQIYRAVAPKGEVINSVGAGDSMVAGLIAYECLNGDTDMSEAFRWAVAAGSASAFSLGMTTKSQVIELSDRVLIETVN